MNATTLKLIWTATGDWLEVAEKQGLIVDWESEPCSWVEIQELARELGIDPNDEDMGTSCLTEPRDCDTLLRAGDVILTTGPGGDVYFFRK